MPQACTLPTVEQLVRVAEFDQFFAESVQRLDRPEPRRLDLLFTAGAEAAARDLAARETSCCSFFTFVFHVTDIGPVMQVGVPAAYVEVLDAFAAQVDAAIGGQRW